MWDIQQILTQVEQDLAARMNDANGYGDRVKINSGNNCAYNVLRMGRQAVFTYAEERGADDAFATTQRIFGPLTKPLGLDLDNVEDAAELQEVFSKDDEEEFNEALFKFIKRKAIGAGIDKLPDVFTEDLDDIDEVTMDYVKDEAKEQAGDLYDALFTPEDTDVFSWEYDPGMSYGAWIFSRMYNFFESDPLCPTPIRAILTTLTNDEGDGLSSHDDLHQW